MPVYQNHQFHVAWPSEIYQGIHCGPYGSPCVQHIIYQYHIPVLHAEGYIGLRRHLYIAGLVHIIPVKSDVQLAIIYALVGSNVLYHLRNTV